jgi:hypothetical protein
MGPILLFINLCVLFIIVSKITFVNHLVEFVRNIYFYCLLLLLLGASRGTAVYQNHTQQKNPGILPSLFTFKIKEITCTSVTYKKVKTTRLANAGIKRSPIDS